MTTKHTPRIGEITTKNGRQHVRSFEVQRKRNGSILVYGLTAARGQSTEYTGFMILDTRDAVQELIVKLGEA